MLLKLPNPVPEHAQIKTVMQSFSDDSKAVYFDRHGGAFVFNTSLELRQVHARFDKVLRSGDTFLIVEIGPDWMSYGHNVAAGWLTHRLGKEIAQQAA